LIFYGVRVLTGYEIGLISILVGFLVGGGVRRGADYRGGRAYQFLAVFLTYFAIGASYLPHAIPFILSAIDQPAEEGLAENDAKGNQPEAKNAKVAKPKAAKGARAPKAAKPGDGNNAQAFSAGQFALALVVVGALGFAFTLALPVLFNYQSPFGIVIVGFALWEAWKLNRKVIVAFNGPFEVGADGDSLPAEQPSHA
jgi:hypothetical protein